eukprot:scaffold57968_cov61-Phaeocystis_antarctica.AAC.1
MRSYPSHACAIPNSNPNRSRNLNPNLNPNPTPTPALTLILTPPLPLTRCAAPSQTVATSRREQSAPFTQRWPNPNP